MYAALLGSSTTGTSDSYSPNLETAELSFSVTISVGSNRLLFVSAHTRGNTNHADVKWIRLYSGYVDPTNRGTLVATLTAILDVEVDSILHAEYAVLLDADMPAAGTYTCAINAQNDATTGAYAIAGGWALFSGLEQTYTPLTAQAVYPPGSMGDISQSITIPASGVVLDNWSGDGSPSPKTPTDQARTAGFLTQGPTNDLNAKAYYTTFEAAGTYTFGYDTGNHNRDDLGIFFWDEVSLSPGSPPACNVYMWGANF